MTSSLADSHALIEAVGVSLLGIVVLVELAGAGGARGTVALLIMVIVAVSYWASTKKKG